jgi:hypothetical protein
MPRIDCTINVRDRGQNLPLRRAYVEHVAFGVRVPGSELYITDDNGRVRDGSGDFGIDAIPNLLNGKIDVRVICHNSVVKIPNGPLDHWVDFSIADGDTRTINNTTAPGRLDHWRLLNRFAEVYDRVFRQFGAFSNEFPLGKRATLDATRTQSKRIEVFFPTLSPGLPFVEPRGLHTRYPIIHMKEHDGRLFGTGGADPDLVPAELSHALHFSKLSDAQRHSITINYPKWIIADALAGGGGTHNLTKDTDPLVAFVEAFDHFAHRLDRFMRENPQQNGPALRNAFIRRQLERRVRDNGNNLIPEFGRLTGPLSTGTFVPNAAFLTSGSRSATSIEGTIYAALFLDFARRPGVGLRTVVQLFIQSKALSFGEFRTWVNNNRPQFESTLDQVCLTWTL